jgi:hypothetical protein
MGIRRGAESAYIQERRKWEQRPVMVDANWVPPQVVDGKPRAGFMDGTWVEPLSRDEGGVGPYEFHEFPKMLYRATRQTGGPQIDQQIIVKDEADERMQRGQGYHARQEDALAAVAAQDLEFAKLAAERNYELLRMSDKARTEVQAFEEQHATHQPTIPETPKRRYVRKAKPAPQE